MVTSSPATRSANPARNTRAAASVAWVLPTPNTCASGLVAEVRDDGDGRALFTVYERIVDGVEEDAREEL